jgi:integrase
MRTETVGTKRNVAERLSHQRERELNEGKLSAVLDVSYGEFVAEELGVMSGRLAEKSLADLRRTLRSFGGTCGNILLARVTPRMVEEYFTGRISKVSRAAANKDLRNLKAALNRAVKRGYLERNPAAQVKQVREAEKRLRILSPEEVGRLLSACPTEQWKTLVALGVTTGMRLGEMLALRWEEVDLEGSTVWVGNESGHLTKSRRARVLALLPGMCGLLGGLPRSGDYVFHTREGMPWCHSVQHKFNRIVSRAGIKRCTLHDLRRTFVSHLAMAGVNEAVVQKLAGHASIATTVKYYTGILPEAQRAAQERLPFAAVLRDVSDTYHGAPLETPAQKSRVVTLFPRAG